MTPSPERAVKARVLQESEERTRGALQRLDSLLENAPLAVIEWSSIDFTIIRWSDEATRMFGWSAEETVGKRIDELTLVYPPDWPLVEQAMADMLSGKRPRNVNRNRNVRKDGTVIHSEWYNSTVRDSAGTLVAVLSLVLDVTERNRALDALRRSEASLAQAGKMAHLGAWWIDISNPDDLNANPLHWSDEVYRIFGYAPGAVQPTNSFFFERVPAEDRARVAEAVARARAERQPYVLEHRISRADGTERVVLEHAQFTYDARGAPVRLIGAVQDITEHRRTEQALRDADRRKNEFLGVLSHELRNPLAPIRNALYVLDRAAPGGDQAARARAVLGRQVGHLTRLVDDLLDVTRISRGKIQLQRSRIDLGEVVRRTVEDHKALLAERGIALEVRIAPGPLEVDADETRVAQIVGNLLQNGAKFTDRGGHIAVAVERGADEVAIRVRDSGIGISADMMGRLFEPFAQADESLHRSRGGLGLGLALVKGLVELHGGAVEARSDGVGRGTELIVRLRLAEGGGQARANSASAEPVRPRRILVIEDNLDAAETLREMLEMRGHLVEVTHDGRRGIEKARAFRPDVVLCDIGLPEMDGYAVARAIRSDASVASTVLVALTGYALPDDQRRAAEAGFDAHVAKPASIEQILGVVSAGAHGTPDGFVRP